MENGTKNREYGEQVVGVRHSGRHLFLLVMEPEYEQGTNRNHYGERNKKDVKKM
jgi:hypothetical protein